MVYAQVFIHRLISSLEIKRTKSVKYTLFSTNKSPKANIVLHMHSSCYNEIVSLVGHSGIWQIESECFLTIVDDFNVIFAECVLLSMFFDVKVA